MTKLFEDVQSRLDILQGIVDLAALAPKLDSLDQDNFKFINLDAANYLKNAPKGY